MKGICIGLGVRGKSWYSWAQQAGIEVVGVVDINEEILRGVGDELGIPEDCRYATISAAAEETDAEVATICTSNATHAAAIEECLEAGLHVMVEKPIVETLQDCQRLMKKAQQNNLRIAVAQNYRYTPGVLALHTLMKEKRIGKPLTLNVWFYRWRPTQGMLLPLMLNMSIHHFDAVRHLLGCSPRWCFAKSWNPSWNECDGPTVLEAMWEFEDGTVFNYSGSYVAQGKNTPYSGVWRIEGEKGQVAYEGDGNNATVMVNTREPQAEEKITIPTPPLDDPAMVCRDFVEALSRGEVPSTDSTDNIKSLAMCIGAEMSSRENRVVHTSEILR